MTADQHVELGQRISKLSAEWLKAARDAEILAAVYASTHNPTLHRRAIELVRQADLEREHARQVLGMEELS
jgi:hypothetical protein